MEQLKALFMKGSRWGQDHGWWSSGAYRGEISFSEWQCGFLRTAHNVYDLIISRVEVVNGPSRMGWAHSPQAVGCTGMARPAVIWDEPAGSCTTHKESFISLRTKGIRNGEMSFIQGVGIKVVIPSPWRPLGRRWSSNRDVGTEMWVPAHGETT